MSYMNYKSPFWNEPNAKIETCPNCKTRFVRVNFGQNNTEFTQNDERHCHYKGKCYINLQELILS